VHFYFKIKRKSQTNKGTVKHFGARARRRAARAATSATGPRPRLPEAHVPSPGRSRTEARGNPPCRVSRRSHAMDRQSVACPCACAPSETKSCTGRSSSAPRLAAHRLFKAAKPPHARTRPRRPAPQAATAPPWPPTVSFPLHAIGLPFVHALATTTLHHSLQSRGLLGRTGILAGMLAAMAAAGPLRRPRPPPVSPPPTPAPINPR
jgi:hypothetical protein